MAIRTDIKDFPFDCRTRTTWFFLIDWTHKKTIDFCNVSCKSDLVKKLKEILSQKEADNYELFGVWNGQYSTDIFKIPIEKGHSELSKYF